MDYEALERIAEQIDEAYVQLRMACIGQLAGKPREQRDEVYEPLQELASQIGLLNQWIMCEVKEGVQ